MPDLYAALGVDEDADAVRIRTSYLRLMRQNHPDLRPGDPASEEASRRLNAAYEVLGDPVKRATYDRLRAARQPAGAVVVMPRPRGAAYSAERGSFQRSFSAALLRVAAVLLAVGTFLLTVAPH